LGEKTTESTDTKVDGKTTTETRTVVLTEDFQDVIKTTTVKTCITHYADKDVTDTDTTTATDTSTYSLVSTDKYISTTTSG
jgi:hypothetical protein